MSIDSTEAQNFENLKRLTFLIVLPLGVAAALVALAAERTINPGVMLSQLPFLSLAGWLSILWVVVLSTRRIPKWFEYLVFASLNVFFLVKLAEPLFLPELPQDDAPRVTVLGYWYPVLYSLAFVMFGFRRGVKLSVLFYAITFVIIGIIFVQHLIDEKF